MPKQPTAHKKPPIPEYYQKLPDCESLLAKIRNLDDSSDFTECQYRLGTEETRNFVVDFDDNGAWCAFNVEKDELSALIDRNALTSRYGMSHRLGGLMCSDPFKTKKITPVSPKLACDSPTREEDNGDGLPQENIVEDVETGYRSEKALPVEASKALEESQGFDTGGISFSQLVDKIWHFSSVDYGNEYLCIGYNSLYVIPTVTFKQQPGRPDGKRLTAQGTVISIQENPFAQETLTPDQRREALKVIRRNTGLVLFGISKQHGEKKKKNPLMGTHIRNPSNSSHSSEVVRVGKGEGPSLLFYYIFDDWATNYSLVIGREHSYSSALGTLRTNMLEKPQVNLVTDLHRVGRELAVLKRLYQSYELIATRILNRQWQMTEQLRNGSQRTASQIRGLNKYTCEALRQDTWRSIPDERGLDESADDFGPQHIGGVQLKPAALNRIERLADRIRLYALSEIEECLNEKETLTFLGKVNAPVYKTALYRGAEGNTPEKSENVLMIQVA
ncbi:hypothetical protein PRK78_001218 [Emydomyces testavorans]|uniref:Uncharacterized protein n=1 Tax=Emydomyces testavorans TaxID=2070801 RepID=A0AAF0DCJ2_9EURO|nr:hypothetical protein PRK78_001218 [Emydomyces testavorans]